MWAERNHKIVRSQTLPREVEDQIRVLVFDRGNARKDDSPRLIVGNTETACHGLYYARRHGVEFVFHHRRLRTSPGCHCLIPGESNSTTFQISQELDEHRLRLIGVDEPRMEPELAAMVIMKLFLGIQVPEPFRGQFRE